MKTYNESFEINDNLNWLYISEHPYKILIIGGSGSGKTNVLLNVKSDFHLPKKLFLFASMKAL